MTNLISFLEYCPFWIFIKIMKLFKYQSRILISSKIISFILRNTPKYKKRAFNNLSLIYPEMSVFEKNTFLKNFSNNLGLTFSEFLFNEEYHKYQNVKLNDDSQITEIIEAIKINRPVLIVSGHIGPWEAVRALFKRNGIETAAVYRKSKNIFYQPYHHNSIEAGGKPIFQVGRTGTTAMIKYLKQGLKSFQEDIGDYDGQWVEVDYKWRIKNGDCFFTILHKEHDKVIGWLWVGTNVHKTWDKNGCPVYNTPSTLPINKPIESSIFLEYEHCRTLCLALPP